jgi:hypothetical protein
VIKARLVEVKGRKSIVSGQVEDLAGNVLVEATLVSRLHTFTDYIADAIHVEQCNVCSTTIRRASCHVGREANFGFS